MTSDQTHTDIGGGRESGLKKCPRCGSTDVLAHGVELTCSFCRHAWTTTEHVLHSSDVAALRGTTIGFGAEDIDNHASDLVTLQCQGCGAEVVVHTNQTLQARCHWCRQVLSVNHQIPSGLIPDLILPFSVGREQAVASIKRYVDDAAKHVEKDFLDSFDEQNVVGVYLPYILMDGNFHVVLDGEGHRKSAAEGSLGQFPTDKFQVRREFDLYVDDLAVETSETYRAYSKPRDRKKPSKFSPLRPFDALYSMNERLTVGSATNIINSLQPFDTENAVAFDANFLKEFNSERRDVNIADLEEIVQWQALAIGRERMRETLTDYTAGAVWQSEAIGTRGSRWLAIYMPVWVYSHTSEMSGNYTMTHFIGVNGRTGETVGSLPTNQWAVAKTAAKKSGLIFVTGTAILMAIAAVLRIISADLATLVVSLPATILFFSPLPLWLFFVFRTTREVGKYHVYHEFEKETRAAIDNLEVIDDFVSSYTSDRPSVPGKNSDRPLEATDRRIRLVLQEGQTVSDDARLVGDGQDRAGMTAASAENDEPQHTSHTNH